MSELYPGKTARRITELPDQGCFILFVENEFSYDDGYGGNSHHQELEPQIFYNKEDLIKRIQEYEASTSLYTGKKKYKVMQATPMIVKTSITVNIDVK